MNLSYFKCFLLIGINETILTAALDTTFAIIIFMQVFLPNTLTVFQTICQGVWMKCGGLCLCTLTFIRRPLRRGPFTGPTGTPSW